MEHSHLATDRSDEGTLIPSVNDPRDTALRRYAADVGTACRLIGSDISIALSEMEVAFHEASIDRPNASWRPPHRAFNPQRLSSATMDNDVMNAIEWRPSAWDINGQQYRTETTLQELRSAIELLKQGSLTESLKACRLSGDHWEMQRSYGADADLPLRRCVKSQTRITEDLLKSTERLLIGFGAISMGKTLKEKADSEAISRLVAASCTKGLYCHFPPSSLPSIPCFTTHAGHTAFHHRPDDASNTHLSRSHREKYENASNEVDLLEAELLEPAPWGPQETARITELMQAATVTDHPSASASRPSAVSGCKRRKEERAGTRKRVKTNEGSYRDSLSME